MHEFFLHNILTPVPLCEFPKKGQLISVVHKWPPPHQLTFYNEKHQRKFYPNPSPFWSMRATLPECEWHEVLPCRDQIGFHRAKQVHFVFKLDTIHYWLAHSRETMQDFVVPLNSPPTFGNSKSTSSDVGGCLRL